MRTHDGRRQQGGREDGTRAAGTDRTPGPDRRPAPRLLALQAAAGNAAVVRMVQRSAVDGVLRSAGRPLQEATRAEMEARLGADFSNVRLHEGAAARASAAEVGARAYTSGHHVVIGEGGGDKHTLAHELTHVIQQRHGPVAGTDTGTGLRVSDPFDRFEREAEATARRVMSGPAPAAAAVEQRTARAGAGGALQRTASDDLPQPEEPSAAVPELPAALVQQLQEAKETTGSDAKAVRQAALEALLRYVLDHLPQAVADEDNLVLGYKHSRQGAGKAMALTTTGTSGDKVTMALYRNLFDDYGPAVIHSTLRHELIHAAQAMLMPDEDAADGGDPHVYMDVISDIGQETFTLLQQPMREIETHVWELEHAGRTGIDAGYLKETVDYLLEYADALSANLGQAAVTDRHVEYWKAYLENSVTALGKAAATPAVTTHPDRALAERITGAQARLRGAVDAKEAAAPAGGKRAGGTGRGATGQRKRGKRGEGGEGGED
ncbi:DUF4157 domain-containing protein [Kitasatospora sp. NPDC059088]|uniref:eCIS core domain-containing protein n=1 Tax=Kitasatospora sp. NPDC059088 TaxID=3346722 RepID=UPI003683801C